MILRRLAVHMRTLNWVAVALDLFIVVLGVFLGMQVSNWNESRAENRRAAEYTQHLLTDLQGQETVLDAATVYLQQVSRSAEETLDILMGRRTASNEQLLINAYRATQYTLTSNFRSTFDGLVATGDLNLIRDVKLRDAVVRFYTVKVFDVSETEGRQSRYREAFRMTIAPETYRTITKNCGDRPTPSGGSIIGYACRIDLPQAAIDGGAKAVRENRELPALLRLRIAELDNELGNFEGTKQFLEITLREYKARSGDAGRKPQAE